MHQPKNGAPHSGIELQRNSEVFSHQSIGNLEPGNADHIFDEDDNKIRTGTFWTATAHIITAVIGSGVLSLAWGIAQLGWIAGPAVLVVFSFVTLFTSTLLADCYRSPGPVTGKRNHTYMDAVKTNLGKTKAKLCGLAQQANFFGITIGYTITTAISAAAIKRANCFHKNGHDQPCHGSKNTFMIIFGAIQIFLSQLPNFHKLWGLSILAAIMSFAYSAIGVGLSIARFAERGAARTTLTGVTIGVDVTKMGKVWRASQALGNIAFAYSYSSVLIEIQDTLKSSPPENKVMKKASFLSICIITGFYCLCGCFGYAALGNDAPGNFLTGFGFYEPFWLIDFANTCIVVHLVCAYQVFSQPLFGFVEGWCRKKWPDNVFLTKEYAVNLPLNGPYNVNMFQLVWRTIYVILTTLVAVILPFFNDILGLLGAIAFWPLTVYFPVDMYVAQKKIGRFTTTWTWLQILSFLCFLVSLAAACGSIQGIVQDLKTYEPFKDG